MVGALLFFHWGWQWFLVWGLLLAAVIVYLVVKARH